MKTVAIIGCGNIGYRHFQATCNTPAVGQVVVVEPDQARLETAVKDVEKHSPSLRISAFPSIEKAVAEVKAVDCVISALTTDIQTRLMPQILAFDCRHYLFEKPFAQSKALMNELCGQVAKKTELSNAYVNCSRNLWDGYQRIRNWIGTDRSRTSFHMDVIGNLWGLGCNTVHFLEYFRYMTGAQTLKSVSTQLLSSPYGNKRGAQYEEFVGTAAFANELGDTIQITSGAAIDKPTGIFVTFKEKANDLLRFALDEDKGMLFDFTEGKRTAFDPLYVSKSTRLFLEKLFQNPSTAMAIPNLNQAKLVHFAFFDALHAATKRDHFAIT
ncbi:MAG: Gfo/Idh/MocA family oxidoreductase [Bacteriovoracia bacterium]